MTGSWKFKDLSRENEKKLLKFRNHHSWCQITHSQSYYELINWCSAGSFTKTTPPGRPTWFWGTLHFCWWIRRCIDIQRSKQQQQQKKCYLNTCIGSPKTSEMINSIEKRKTERRKAQIYLHFFFDCLTITSILQIVSRPLMQHFLRITGDNPY